MAAHQHRAHSRKEQQPMPLSLARREVDHHLQEIEAADVTSTT
ncbi:hypothetical protein [Streptomyces solicathayae]|uniref:Transposase n=1 Tax=Streptomyces solicathayae TaxID=3081768 RepID=A0ABZ0M3K5_9ACTN|nr:hypothetical protein [Streptomyces sp. HUAS YS2]WOX26362.1 hypothetical protein R2D22_35315 [Streptomyces sp. HUAS YS2]